MFANAVRTIWDKLGWKRTLSDTGTICLDGSINSIHLSRWNTKASKNRPDGRIRWCYIGISSKINIKPTLKVIEPHRLEALIIEDLLRYPKSKSADIQKRIEELPIEDIRKKLLAMETEGKVLTEGSKKGKVYYVAKKN